MPEKHSGLAPGPPCSGFAPELRVTVICIDLEPQFIIIRILGVNCEWSYLLSAISPLLLTVVLSIEFKTHTRRHIKQLWLSLVRLN